MEHVVHDLNIWDLEGGQLEKQVLESDSFRGQSSHTSLDNLKAKAYTFGL